MRIAIWLFVLALLAPLARAAEVTVTNAWLRAPAPGQAVAGVYMTLNSPVAAKLLAAHSRVAGNVQLHTMSMQDGIMRMRQVTHIDLPAGQPVMLAPGGLHIMLMDLRQSLPPGAVIPLELDIKTASGARETVRTQAMVRGLGGQPMAMPGQ